MVKILKGNIIHTIKPSEFEVHEDSYLISENHKVVGIYKDIPEPYVGYLVEDYSGYLIIPSFIDLHLHAPQYMQMGIGLNLELIDWLEQYTFMLEGRFADVNYAKKVYPHFVDALYEVGTLRSCIFGTIHDEANRELVRLLKEKRLCAYVGKVNMDRNAPVSLTESKEKSLRLTKDFIEDYKEDTLVQPIITPRFAPSCTSELLGGLGELSSQYEVPVQSHLSENHSEIEWVKGLFPSCKNYSDVYRSHGLLGPEKTLMAHGIYLEVDEIDLLRQSPVYLIHCPNSNMNLTSGIMPLTRFIDMGLTVGLGSDIGAGHRLGMHHTIVSAIQSSKIRHLLNEDDRLLTESEGFYLATKVNGSFFGKCGSFEPGYSLDCLIIRDPHPLMDSIKPLEQLQRFLYCGDPRSIHARFLEGKQI